MEQAVQNAAMDAAAVREFGGGVRAATWGEYAGKRISGLPATNTGAHSACFSGGGSVGSGGPLSKLAVDSGAPLDGSAGNPYATLGARIAVAVRPQPAAAASAVGPGAVVGCGAGAPPPPAAAADGGGGAPAAKRRREMGQMGTGDGGAAPPPPTKHMTKPSQPPVSQPPAAPPAKPPAHYKVSYARYDAGAGAAPAAPAAADAPVRAHYGRAPLTAPAVSANPQGVARRRGNTADASAADVIELLSDDGDSDSQSGVSL